MSQLLFTAFSNRDDAIKLARDVGERLASEGIGSTLHLLDSSEPPALDGWWRSTWVSWGSF